MDHPCGDDVAAYALGALDDGEATRFERHLETCAVCRDELEAFGQVVDVLPMTAPQFTAPPALRRRVLAEVAGDSRGRTARRVVWPRLPRPALGLAGALAVAAVAVVIALSSGPNSRTIAAQVTGAGTATIRVENGHADLAVHHFPAPPSGKIYEVWLVRGSARPSPTSALFSVTARGDADVDVPGNLRGVTQIMVTPEPAGGSQRPTHAAVIQASLT